MSHSEPAPSQPPERVAALVGQIEMSVKEWGVYIAVASGTSWQGITGGSKTDGLCAMVKDRKFG
jgi:hypothetical protein